MILSTVPLGMEAALPADDLPSPETTTADDSVTDEAEPRKTSETIPTEQPPAESANSPPSQEEEEEDKVRPLLREWMKLAEIKFDEDTPEAQSRSIVTNARKRLDVSTRLLRENLDEEIRTRLVLSRFEARRILVDERVPGALDDLLREVEPYQRSSNQAVRHAATEYVIKVRLQRLIEGNADEAAALVQSTRDALAEGVLPERLLPLMRMNAKYLEAADLTLLAQEHWRMLLAAAENLPADELADLKADAEVARRRLDWIAKPFPVEGMLLEGGQLDWEKYRGKVVLLDFWASWCLPCRADLHNIRRLQKRYSEQGFAVIGVCIDEDRKDIIGYLDGNDSHAHWTLLFEQDETRRGMSHPIAVAAGVDILPTAILLDRDGRVLSTAARGANLEHWLRKLFHDPLDRQLTIGEEGLRLLRPEMPRSEPSLPHLFPDPEDMSEVNRTGS